MVEPPPDRDQLLRVVDEELELAAAGDQEDLETVEYEARLRGLRGAITQAGPDGLASERTR
ncbi:hypothetical protein G5V58_04075 [Nocardioides anomalus]|uniref:Uncharacterized protein n=1 Tax=Nocardioides anomalus TaxID=2712223 RepID=A0A6G6WA71_9ACTN|nr:hypothetical protein [Nocardioides anomalus]QIG42057.1 hypothetical protein G5V58_04075 [Nocardioides anomalus]